MHQVDALRVSEPRVKPFGLPEAIPCAVDIEEIARGRAHQRGPRRPHVDVVGVSHAERVLGVDVLFAILRSDSIHQPAKAGQIATRSGAIDPLVQRRRLTFSLRAFLPLG